jgi:two-component system sensor histidine kinase UhpB
MHHGVGRSRILDGAVRLAHDTSPRTRSENTNMTPKKKPRSRPSADATRSNPSLERTEQLSDLLHRLDTLRDQERMQLSRELHDTLVSALSASKLECDWMLRAQRENDAENHRRLSRVSGSLAEAIQFTRQVMDGLWPAAVQHLGLIAALEGQLADLRARGGFEVRPDVKGDMESLPEVHAMTLYRAVKETLNLTPEDASSTNIELSLRRTPKGVELRVIFPGSALRRESSRFELDGALMRERVLRLRGEYLLEEASGGNAQLHLFLPLPPPGAAETASAAS